ncbi:DUF1244 domain-containing protein [Mycobacterium tuberculosis]
MADWIRDAGYPGDKEQAREVIHGMPSPEWKATRLDRRRLGSGHRT